MGCQYLSTIGTCELTGACRHLLEEAMRIIVTGACGMLGRLVVGALGIKHHVVPTDILESCEIMDISDTSSVFDVINRLRPELVIHCAAMTNVDGCEQDPDNAYKINAIGTMNLACACASIDAAVLYISTDYVFDGTKTTGYTEFDEPNPINHYGASKLAGENIIKEICPKHYIVRTSWLFAPHSKNFALSILNAAEKNKELRVVADQIGSPTYCKDLATFVESLVGSPLYGTYHFSNSGSCSWHEFASEILKKAGKADIIVKPITSDEWPTPTKRPKHSVLRHYKMELLGRDSARPWQDAVAELIEEWTIAKQ